MKTINIPLKTAIPRTYWPYFAMLIGIVSIGFGGIFIRWSNSPGPVASFYRMAIALVILAYPVSSRLMKGKINWKGAGLAFLAGIFFGADMAFWSTGVTISGATIPTLLANTAPIWVGLGALLIFRTQQKGIFWLGLAISLAGAFIILDAGQVNLATLDLGGLLGAVAGVFYAGFFLIAQKGRNLLNSLSFLWFSVLGSMSVLLAVVLLRGYPLIGYSTQAYLSFLGFGLITQVVGWFSINYAQGHLPATIVAPTMLGQPVTTAILSVLLLGEKFTFWKIVGGLAILTGVYLAHQSQNGQKGTSTTTREKSQTS